MPLTPLKALFSCSPRLRRCKACRRDVRLWDFDFPEVELKDGRGKKKGRKNNGWKNSGQKNKNGAKDVFHFSVRCFSVDVAIRLNFRLLTRAVLLLMARRCYFFACFRGSSFGLT
jgi:hypothetical protein